MALHQRHRSDSQLDGRERCGVVGQACSGVSREGDVGAKGAWFRGVTELLREPLLGRVPDAHWWLLALGITLAGYAAGFTFYTRFRARITYYL